MAIEAVPLAPRRAILDRLGFVDTANAGRLGALLFGGLGVFLLLVHLIDVDQRRNESLLLMADVAILLVGIGCWVVPWQRLASKATLIPAVLIFAAAAVRNTYGGLSLYTFGVVFILVFIWVGATHRPFTSLLIAPVAAVFYLAPIFLRPDAPSVAGFSAIYVLPSAVLAGELLSMTTTRLREAELRLERAYRELLAIGVTKEAIITAVQHEVRTPLQAILGFSDLLVSRDDVLTPEMRTDAARRIHGGAARLQALLTDLMDVEQLLQGTVEPRPEAAGADELVARCLRSLRVPPDRLQVILHAPAPAVYADPQHVCRMVQTLVSNAMRRASADARVALHVAVQHHLAVFTVEDDGPPVPASERKALFEPFTPESRTPHNPGVGLSLALVARLAEMNGGRVWMDGGPEGSTQVKLVLPSVSPTRDASISSRMDHTLV